MLKRLGVVPTYQPEQLGMQLHALIEGSACRSRTTRTLWAAALVEAVCVILHRHSRRRRQQCLSVLTSSHMAARLAAAGQLLVRSGMEIDRILGSMVEDAATISASLPSKGLFLSRLVSVDPVRQRIQVSSSEQQSANSSLLSARSIVLRCNHRGARYAFSATRPRRASHGNRPAIELALPTQLLALQPGRAAQPMQVPLLPQLDCQMRMGILAFDAKLVDVSLDGRAFLIHDDVIPLCAGTHVSGARIQQPGRAPLLVDFEIRHVIPAVLPDGRRATRIGCRIRAAHADLEALLRLFIVAPG